MGEGKGGKPVNVDAKEAAKIVALYRDHHLPLTALAERFRHTVPTIRKVLKDAGIEIQSVSARSGDYFRKRLVP